MNKEQRPYIVSDDVFELMNNWAIKNYVLTPNKSYFNALSQDINQVLSASFETVDTIPEAVIKRGLQGKVRRSRVSTVSLDRAYLGDNQDVYAFLDLTRTVDQNLSDLGLGARRVGQGSLSSQIGNISRSLKLDGITEITLADDVIFEGKSALEIVSGFEQLGVRVSKVIAAIGVEEGITLLESNGIETDVMLNYQAVTDEICQRDFVVGAPLSGRTLVSEQGEVFGVPYLLPFGKPVEWASIPELDAVDFSLAMLAISRDLWQKIEELTGESVSPQVVDKPVWGLSEQTSMSKALSESIKQIKRSQNG